MSRFKGMEPAVVAFAFVAALLILFAWVFSTFDWGNFVINVNNFIKLTYDIDDRGTKTLAFLLSREGSSMAVEELGMLRAGKEPAGFAGKAAEALAIEVVVWDEKSKEMKAYGKVKNEVETNIPLPGLRVGRIGVS